MLKKLNDLGEEQSRFLIAKVVENNDPLKMQRVKVTIPQLLEGDTEKLPWVLPVVPSSLGGNTKTALEVSVPPVGSHVVIVLQNNDVNYGLIVGSLPPSSGELGVLETNYPNRRGWVDRAGNHFFVDTLEGQVSIEIRHASGTTVNIDKDGNLTVTTEGNTSINASGDLAIESSGGMKLTSGGTMDFEAAGNMTITAPRVDVQ